MSPHGTDASCGSVRIDKVHPWLGRPEGGPVTVPTKVPHPSSVAPRALRRQIPEVGAECPNGARSALCGGRSVMSVPTAISEMSWQNLFERSHRFSVIEPNSGHRDYSRSSCDGGRRSLRTRSIGTDIRPETFVVT